MTTRTPKTSPLIRARVAGFLYLILFPLDLFGFLYVPSRLVVPGDSSLILWLLNRYSVLVL
jgi:hypothetical protein